MERASAPVLFVRLLVLVLQALMADGAVAPVDARMRVQDVEWSDDERAIMARAEKLRWYSRRVEAENLMAVHVALPSIITTRNVHQASKLDISRWYAAQTGKQWDWINPTIVIFEPKRGVDDEHRVRGVSNGILKYIFAPDARQRKGHNDGGSC